MALRKAAAGRREAGGGAGARRRPGSSPASRWRRRHGTALTVPFGAAATLSGRLLDAEGPGSPAARLRVVSRPSRGALVPTSAGERRDRAARGLQARAARRALAADRGRLRRRGPARLRPGAAPLSLRVRGGVQFHAAPVTLRTGQAVRFWGRVRAQGAPLPRRGKLVAIQYLETATGRWRPVLVTRSDHAGRFHARYRFRYLSGAARIRLRAVALAEERWPYAPGASPAADGPRQRAGRVPAMSQATLHTNAGPITVELHDEDAPKTVENFRKLAADGFYDELVFHRVIPDFMIQGGCPEGTGRGGPGYTFEDEFNDHKIVRGALAMANAGPNTNGSQFFIVTTDAAPWLDGKHTVFGKVTDGMDAVDAIESTPTGAGDKPVEPQTIERVELSD